MEIVMCGDLASALASAAAAAVEGEVVLLAPGCASFDQFRDYAHCGDSFRSWVQDRIKEAEPRPAAAQST
jgi:UDP-N-acetylmuramoylalanine--D-glutamate ligase